MEQVFARVPREVLYQRTGIQFLPINTLFQLYAHEQMQPGELAYASPPAADARSAALLAVWLAHERVHQRLHNAVLGSHCAGAWATDLLAQLGIPTAMLPPVVNAGTVLGEVLPALRGELGPARVIAPATHDTGSAIVATPVSLSEWLGLYQFWHVVAGRPGTAAPGHDAEALAANCHQRGRRLRHDPLPQKRDGALAAAGMPAPLATRWP